MLPYSVLLNWRSGDFGLARVRATGGVVLQIVVPPGPSKMQLAEAEMAAEKGIEVLTVDCMSIRTEAFDYHFAEMPKVQALLNSAASSTVATRSVVPEVVAEEAAAEPEVEPEATHSPELVAIAQVRASPSAEKRTLRVDA